MPEKMESYVNCPVCGELAHVILTPYNQTLNDILSQIQSILEIPNTNIKIQHFGNDFGTKCKCGKIIHATLHISAV